MRDKMNVNKWIEKHIVLTFAIEGIICITFWTIVGILQG